MKTYAFVISSVLFTATAFAAENLVFQQDVSLPLLAEDIARGTEDDRAAAFVANTDDPKLERAWIKIKYPAGDPHDDTDLTYRVERVQIPGLKYDGSKNEIYFESESKRHVCARNIHASFWRGQAYEATPGCHLKLKYDRIDLDNGLRLSHPIGARLSLVLD